MIPFLKTGACLGIVVSNDKLGIAVFNDKLYAFGARTSAAAGLPR